MSGGRQSTVAGGSQGQRVYLDHNATAPLRPEARAAMAAAMDVIGNPSSVHAEGRAARGLVERARGRIAAALGATGAEIVFTSGATEAAALALEGRRLAGAGIEHEAVLSHVEVRLPVDAEGRVGVNDPARATLQLANSETGVVQTLPAGLAVSDITQGAGRLPFAFDWAGIGMAFLSGHKIGGPKGVGVLVMQRGFEIVPRITGGGQEMGRRAGTENLFGIAGLAAALEAAVGDLAAGRWEEIAQFRNILEEAIAASSPETIVVGTGAVRLPNTSCLLTPGWKGEMQVMAMDIAGFAVSAGSACSSGKMRASRALTAMGHDAEAAASAIRVSLGLETRRDEVLRFAEAWSAKRARQRSRAA
jgi:cysteine desulfurase